VVKQDEANQTRTKSLKRTIASLQCEMSKQAKTESRSLTKFEEEIESASQSLEEATKTIVAQRQELVGKCQELAATNAKATKMLVAQRQELAAASSRTIHHLQQQQRLFMLQHMSNATAPTTQKCFCVLM
jgi:predicted  nucleic acid-binding Zn-ribbon protein